jgi:hypothetical protein
MVRVTHSHAVVGLRALGYYGGAQRTVPCSEPAHNPQREFLCQPGDETMKPTPLLLLIALASPAIGFAAPAPQPSSTSPDWRQTQKTDAVSGTVYTRFTLVGSFLSAPQQVAADRPALVLDCVPAKGSSASQGKLLAGNLLVGTTVKIVYVEPEEIHGIAYFPKVDVRFRADGNKEAKEEWSAGAEKTSAAIPKDSLEKILHARSFAISADDASGSRLAMQFDIPDATLVKEGCNVN